MWNTEQIIKRLHFDRFTWFYHTHIKQDSLSVILMMIPVYLYLDDLQFHAVQDGGSSSGRDGIQHTETRDSLILNFKPVLEPEVHMCSMQ